MYRFVEPIPNTQNAVVRPVIYKLLRELMDEGMLPAIKRIEYNDAIAVAKLNGTALCNKAARMKCETFITIGAVTEYRTDDDQWGRTWAKHRIPVWIDSVNRLTVTPLYDELRVTLTIQIVTTSLSTLRQWRDKVRMKQRRGRQRIDHKLEYAMPFPRMAYSWFKDMYGDDVDKRIQHYGVNAIDIISSGTHMELVVSEYQTNAKGHMMTTTPSIAKLNSGSYTGEMTYQLEYNKPISMQFDYPIMVNQRIVPEPYLPVPPRIPAQYWVESPMDAGAVINSEPPKPEVLHVPNFDRKVLVNYPNYYHPVVTVLVSIDADHPLSLFNLYQLGDVHIDEDILDVIKKYYLNEVTQRRESPFLLTLHNDDNILHADYLSVTSELDVKLTRPVVIDGIYRVSLCILTNTAYMTHSKYRGLVSNHTALVQYVNAVNAIVPDLMSHGINPDVIPSDFKSGHYLKHWSPLVCIRKTKPPKDHPRPWEYVPYAEYIRGTSDGHIHTKTVQTQSTSTKPGRVVPPVKKCDEE